MHAGCSELLPPWINSALTALDAVKSEILDPPCFNLLLAKSVDLFRTTRNTSRQSLDLLFCVNTRFLRARYYRSPRFNGTGIFYNWIGENLRSEMVVLNLGAGPKTEHPLRVLKGRVRKVVGADIDPVVLANDELDAAFLIGPEGRLPFEAASFDVVFSDYVLEHVEDPGLFLRETRRVLKPGGSFFFRTPNRFHYVALLAGSTPHWFHDLVANRVRGAAENQHKPWPTFYRANTRRRLQLLAQASGFQHCELRMVETEPAYLSFFAPFYLLGIFYERAVNAAEGLSPLRANIFGRFR